MPEKPTIRGVELAEIIGQGGFAVVYRGVQSSFNRNVAVKILLSTLGEDDSRRRFERECWAIGNVSDHPRIVSVYDSGVTDEGHPYLVMEYVANGSLADELKRRGPIPWKEAVSIAMKIGEALDAAHEAGIVHRDVKPENIMLSRKNEPQLGDFGIARIVGTERTKSGIITASLAYAAPEIFAGAQASPASDQYSLAATVDALIRARPAFGPGTEESLEPLLTRIVTQPPPSLDPWHVPEVVQRALHRGMAKRPDDRYPSIAAFSSGLAAAADLAATGGFRPEPTVSTTGPQPTVVVSGQRGPDAPSAAGRTGEAAISPPSWSTEFHPLTGVGGASGGAGQGAGSGPPSITSGTTPTAQPHRGSRRRLLVPLVAALVVAGAGGAFLATRSSSPQATPKDTGGSTAEVSTTAAGGSTASTARTGNTGNTGNTGTTIGTSAANATSAPVVVSGSEPGGLTTTASTASTVAQGIAATPSGKGMVAIPAGTYPVGSEKPDLLAESPRRMLAVEGFSIDAHEVTNADYAVFVTKTGAAPPLTGWTAQGPSEAELNHPVRAINYAWASAYCRALSKRLPTEAEWEVAAAGPNGSKFAWGNDLAAVTLPATGTYPVESVAGNKSRFGVYDMTGSVWEWVGDSYDPAKLGPDQHLLRGGQNGYVRNNWSRLPVDEKASNAVLAAGMRCAASKVLPDAPAGQFVEYPKPPPPSVPVVTVPAGFRIYDDFSGSKLDWIEVTNAQGRFGYHPNKFFHLETKVPDHTVVALCPCTMPSGNASIVTSAEVELSLTEPAGTYEWGLVVRASESTPPSYVPSEYLALAVNPRRQIWRAYIQQADGKQIVLGNAQLNITESDLVTLEIRDLGAKVEFYVNGTFRGDAPVPSRNPASNHAGFVLTSDAKSTKAHIHYGSFGVKSL